jgi:hypothetical protein
MNPPYLSSRPPLTPPSCRWALVVGEHEHGRPWVARTDLGVLAECHDHDERRALGCLRPSDPGYREQMRGVRRG